jgi:hypothetical protein
MSRRGRTALIASALVAFVLLSVLLARFLSVENTERDAILGLLRAQARGDATAMLAALHRCDPACRTAVQSDASSLGHPGDVQILNNHSSTAYSLTGATGKTRIAWRQPGRLPVVQCVLVRRDGDVLTGLSVTLLALSRPVPGTADC